MGTPYSNPGFALDSNLATFASGIANAAVSTISACRWITWGAPLGPYSSLKLSIESEVAVPTAASSIAWLGYSTDGGVTWTTIYQVSGTNLTRARTTDNIVLPPGTNLANLQVRASIQTAAGITSTHRIYGIATAGVLTAAVPVTLALANQSANVCVTPPTDPQETAIRLYRRGGTLPDNWFQVGQFAVVTLAQGSCGAGTLLINDNIPDSQAQLGAILPQDNFQPIQSVQAVNFPLPVIFGPSDGRVLACGDPARPDAVYFSNRGNADLWGAESWVTVANPGEQIMNGLVYNLRTFSFSRERMYIMLPNIIQGVTFVAAPTPCRRGLKGRWGFVEGERGIYFWSKDGIYRTGGGPEESIIDDSIRPLFPTREAPTGTPTNGYDAINMADEDGLRMAFHNGEIWCFYTGATTGLRQLLIFDEHRSRWRPGTYVPAMQMAYSEPNTNSSLLYGGTNGSLYAAGGSDDAGTVIPVAITTGARDQERPLNLKQYLTLNLDIDPGGATTASPVVVTPRLNGETLADFALKVTGSGRQRVTLPLNDGWEFSQPGAFVYNAALKSVYGRIITLAGAGFQGEVAAQLKSSLGPDQFAEVTVAKYLPFPLGPGGNNHTIGPAVRMTIDPATGLISCYAFSLSYDSFGRGLIWEVGVRPGQGFGVETTPIRDYLVPQVFGAVVSVGDVLRIEAVGNQITAKINGAIVFGPVTDNRIATGQPGIEGYPENSDISNATQVSNFRCGALPTGVVLTPSLPFAGGEVYAYNLELDLAWNAAAAIKPILYQYELLYRHEPAEVTHWELPPSSMGQQGWFHIRDMYIVLRSTADVTLTITTDASPPQVFTLPNTYGRKQTIYLKLAANKANSYAFALDSAAPFRAYNDECEVRLKQWLTKLGYQNVPLIAKEQIGSMNV